MEYTYSDFCGYRQLNFKFENRDAVVVLPSSEPSGKWMMKMEYFGAFPELECELISRGWHLCYIKNRDRWGTDDDSDLKVRFANFLSKEFGLEKRFCCIGMSCGGICSVNFAARHPDYVSFLYLDAPVMNLYSCPMGFGEGEALGDGGWQELVDAYGFDVPTFMVYRQHPIDKVDILADNGLPAALVYGDSDTCVPYKENGVVLEKCYRERGIPLIVEGKKGCGHHPHGPSDVPAMADFIEKNAL